MLRVGLQQQIWGAVDIRKYGGWVCKGVGRDEHLWTNAKFIVKGTREQRLTLETLKQIMGQGGYRGRGRGNQFNIFKGHRNTNYSWIVSIVLPALLSSLECVLLRYCQFHKLFYCYCATANFTICQLLLRYCQLHNLFYCYSNCATANFTICSTADVLLRYCQLHKFILLRYCQLHKFILLRYC